MNATSIGANAVVKTTMMLTAPIVLSHTVSPPAKEKPRARPASRSLKREQWVRLLAEAALVPLNPLTIMLSLNPMVGQGRLKIGTQQQVEKARPPAEAAEIGSLRQGSS